MKQLSVLVFALIISLSIQAQDMVSTKTGTVKFEASTPNFEPVTATNNTTSAILKANGEFAALTLIQGFQFKKALMKKHFNSKKWVDSKQFPKTKFKGVLVDFKFSELSESPKEYKIVGELTFHGVTKVITPMLTIKKVDGIVYLMTKFNVLIADYGIIVKSKLVKKIAETVNIEVNLALK